MGWAMPQSALWGAVANFNGEFVRARPRKLCAVVHAALSCPNRRYQAEQPLFQGAE
jgi:hypothetical protein